MVGTERCRFFFGFLKSYRRYTRCIIVQYEVYSRVVIQGPSPACHSSAAVGSLLFPVERIYIYLWLVSLCWTAGFEAGRCN